MFQITSTGSHNYVGAVKGNNRKWKARVLYKSRPTVGFSVISEGNIKSFVITDMVGDGKNISVGGVESLKLTCEIKKVYAYVIDELYKGQDLYVELSLFDETINNYIKMRSIRFVVDESKAKKRKDGYYDVSITAYDISYLMNKTFIPNKAQMTAKEIVTQIANRYGLKVTSYLDYYVEEVDGETPVVYDVIEGLTEKQTLGYIAGCYGKFARITVGSEIDFEYYIESNVSIPSSHIYEGGITTNDAKEKAFVMLETGTSKNPIVVPNNASGYSINFENPYITKSQAEWFYNRYIKKGKMVVCPGKVKYKGNPTRRVGDIVDVEGLTNTYQYFYIMKRTINYDGGLSETIESFAENETSINYKFVSPTQTKIDRTLSRMEDAIKNATDVITQTKGSVFELIPINESDPSKGNSGWKLYSTDVGKNNVIVANSSGIGFSSNGGQSFDAAAIYIDENGYGHINGGFITAGSISADKINTSALIVGGGSYDDLGGLLNAVVNTSNSSVTEVDVLYNLHDSQTTAPALPTTTNNNGWQSTVPAITSGKYIWSVTKTVSGGGINYSAPICITSASGTAGKDGVGISNVTNYYLATTLSSGVTTNHDVYSWTDTVQTMTSTKKYLWNYEVITYTDGNTQSTDPVIIGTYGEKGSAGKGISSITEYYATNNDPNSVPTSFSTTVAKPTSSSRYLWNYEVIAYTDGSTSTTTAKRVIGVYGDTGATGDNGRGVSEIKEQYCLSTSNTTSPSSGWQDTQPNWENNKYIWTRSKITWDDNYVSYTTPVLAQALNTANENASSASLTANSTQSILNSLTEVAVATNTVVIKGGMIAANSIGASQIQAGSITADRLSVGTGTPKNLLFNSNITTIDYWNSYACQLTHVGDSFRYKPNNYQNVAGFYQPVWLKKKRYAFVANVNIYNVISVATNAEIKLLFNGVFYSPKGQITQNSWIIGKNRNMIIEVVFDSDVDNKYIELGLGTQGINFGTNGYMVVDWCILFEEPNKAVGFYCSESDMLANDFKDSNKINYSTQYTDFGLPTINSFSVDSSGLLDVFNGTFGAFKFSRSSLTAESHASAGSLGIGYNGYLSVSVPDNSSYSSDLTSTDVIGFGKFCAPSIEINDGNQAVSFMSLHGFYCKNTSNKYTNIQPERVSAYEFQNLSKEKLKKDIVESTSVVEKIKNSKIYNYLYLSDKDNRSTRSGFIVERETPKEIISDDGEGINLYSMASMNWKATQEILERLEAVEKVVNNNA